MPAWSCVSHYSLAAATAVALLVVSASSRAASTLSCADMATQTVPASAIGLPTNGATVTAAVEVAAGGNAPQTYGDYCRVSIDINPVDPAAPRIMMELELPTAWNKRAMMFGGGGYNGSIPKLTDNVPAGPAQRPSPLGRGYAVFASDSGHEGSDADNAAAFALNAEALTNYGHDALKKTRDVAVYLINKSYATAPEHVYFAGGSTGGREALAVAQQWPKDFDGVISLYPAFNAASLNLQFGRITRALAAPGAYPNLVKRAALYDAAMQACDGLDGVEDGLISNQAACNATFDPSTAMLNGHPLRCPGGADVADTCLSDAQIAAMKVINTPVIFNYPLASGENQYPGFNTWGTDFGRPGTGLQVIVNRLGLSVMQPEYPMGGFGTTIDTIPYHSGFWDQWIKYFVTKDPKYNSLSVDPEHPGRWQARISELTKRQDVNKADLSEFAAHGGKILMAHGTSDQLVSTRATEQYFNRVRSVMGPDRTDNFMRYYEIPGYSHALSTVFAASWDSVTTLENWVEKGIAPGPQVVGDTAGVPGRTRPLCEYPSWPKYNGSGDVNAASSFSCAFE
jgi:acetyl esterase/lipase